MAGVSDLFGEKGKNVAEQLVVWGILQQLINTVMQPVFVGLAREINDKLPLTPLTPDALADMVNRHIIEEAAAQDYAAQSGIAGKDFQRMVAAAGDGPAPGDLVEALRRGIIDEQGAGPDSTSFEQGIAESRIRNKWLPVIKELGVREPSPADALDALLEGQIDQATGEELYHKFGGDPEYFQMLYNTRGSAPTPLEAAQMARRGIIPWEGTGPDVVSYQQAFLEGPWRNKWLDPYRQDAAYYPPIRTIVTMLHHGSIDDATALQWFKYQGASDEVAAAMLADAHTTATARSKELTASQITTMYTEGLMSQGEASAALLAAGWTQASADLLIQHADVVKANQTRNQAVTRIRTLYLGRSIDAGAASNALDALSVPHDARDQLLAAWKVELDNSVRRLTEAQYAAALVYGVMDQATAMAGIVAEGYSAHDAWVLLSNRNKGPLPDEPPR